MHKRFVLSIAVPLVLVAVGANAQDKGQIGITMGYPTSIGLIWHASDTVALRPEFAFSHSSSTGSSTATFAGSSSDSTTWQGGISALLYVHKWDKASAYLTPRFSYSRLTSSNTQTYNGSSVTSSSTGNVYSIAGSLGAQYSLSRRFGVFGEAGIAYTDQTTSYPSSESKTKAWGTRAGVGVILYLH